MFVGVFLCLQGVSSKYNNVCLTATSVVDVIFKFVLFFSLDKLAITGEPCYSILEMTNIADVVAGSRDQDI